ncbi:MAG: MotA/TolQ/ExbB proton channel family protein [Verrucomicrobiota bacterium]
MPRILRRSILLPFFFLTLLLPCLGMAQDRFSLPGDGDSPAQSATQEGGEVKQKTYSNQFVKFLDQGGVFVWPLIILSLVIVGLSAYCLFDLTEKNFFPKKEYQALEAAMDGANLAQARSVSESSGTCLGQMMAGATEYIGDRGFQTLDDGALYDAMADASQEVNRGRARLINAFSVIAQSAPMIGLLGTVSGMIKAFDKLGQTGMGDPGQLAANISEALWTTLTGLIVAVPALWLYFYFRDRLAALIGSSDRKAFQLLNRLRRSVVAQTAGGMGPPPAAPSSPPQTPPSAPSGPAPLPQPLPQPE